MAGALLVLLAAGCESTPVNSPASSIVLGEGPYDPGPDIGGLSLQKEILSAGEVTFAEYERAFEAGVSCMRSYGFEVDGPLRYSDDGPMFVEPGGDPRIRLMLLAHGITAEIDEAWSHANQQCQVQWYYFVEKAWLAQNAPSEQEISVWLERAWSCGRDQGLILSDPPTQSEALDAVGLGCRPWEG